MATAKKKPVAKAAAKPAAAKTTPKAVKAKAATTRKTAPKKATTAKQKAAQLVSFRPTKEQAPFMSFNFTIQSFYWLILSVLVLALGAWVMYLNVQIQEIYDQVELNTQLNESYIVPTIEKAHPDTPKPTM